jgi:phosphoribosyl 1,2-cyclic phosphodiesterase
VFSIQNISSFDSPELQPYATMRRPLEHERQGIFVAEGTKVVRRLLESRFADVLIETFSIPHDAQDPVGYILRTAAGNIGFATDLGHVTKLVLERIRVANVLVLESNHDVKMLQDCPRRSWALKQRILGRHGHLSNATAAEAVAKIISADLRQLYLAHLSRECNTPKLAEDIMAEQLHHIGATHVRLQLAAQDVPCETLEL